jgi:hypothetical protein
VDALKTTQFFWGIPAGAVVCSVILFGIYSTHC